MRIYILNRTSFDNFENHKPKTTTRIGAYTTMHKVAEVVTNLVSQEETSTNWDNVYTVDCVDLTYEEILDYNKQMGPSIV